MVEAGAALVAGHGLAVRVPVSLFPGPAGTRRQPRDAVQAADLQQEHTGRERLVETRQHALDAGIDPDHQPCAVERLHVRGARRVGVRADAGRHQQHRRLDPGHDPADQRVQRRDGGDDAALGAQVGVVAQVEHADQQGADHHGADDRGKPEVRPLRRFARGLFGGGRIGGVHVML